MAQYVPVKARKHRYQQFAAKYVKNGFNGAQTAIDCGFTTNPNSAKSIATRLLTYAYVDAEIAKYKERAKMTADDVLRKLSQVASLDAEFKGSDIVKCNELLAKHHGLIKERVETVDVTTKDATVEALSSHITAAAQREGITDDSAAVSLFVRMYDHPTLSKPSSWGKWQGVIEKYLAEQAAQREQPVIEAGDQ